MTPALALALTGLSLLDSTSFGTLLIPIWLLLTPGRLRAGRIFVYLATVALFYFLVGILLAAGADAAMETVRRAFADVPPVPLRIGQLAAGVLIIVWSYRLEARARRQGDEPGRVHRWRTRAMTGPGSARGLMSLAAVAVALEVATMLPYLAAIALIANSGLGWQLTGGVLAGYCAVMVIPAAALAVARLAAHQRMDPLLRRLNTWLTRNSAKLLGWTIGGLGIGLATNAVVNLMIAG
ncbi:GAP family protein [Nonomuraea sp. SMC257]|uniref:GAP family protein n=1 Tax=Nonomuraea montanisoli TaxID=2741721 RepID=A0A7Y6I9Y2_9ACTN|nr:GAP family protein [Nonomuraea montanisoli]NUW33818.1 GAP family protein [Nonomuraea montanisoli]